MYGQLVDASNSRIQQSGSLKGRDETKTFVQGRFGLHFTCFTTFSRIYKMSKDSKFGSVKHLQATEQLEVAKTRCVPITHTSRSQRNVKAIVLSTKLQMPMTQM